MKKQKLAEEIMNKQYPRRGTLGARITKASSKQTYYTFRLLADRERLEDAYRAYGYFRWVDDILDLSNILQAEKIFFIR